MGKPLMLHDEGEHAGAGHTTHDGVLDLQPSATCWNVLESHAATWLQEGIPNLQMRSCLAFF